MNRHVEPSKTIIIIGGGASGVLLAAHLLRQHPGGSRIIIVDKSGQFGAGMAYSTSNPSHILNIPASGMSAFPDDPDHFLRWLGSSGAVENPSSSSFAPRQIYSRYLASLIAGHQAVTFVGQGCTGVYDHAKGVEVHLENGTSLIGHAAVLAVGHEERQMRGRGLSVRAGSPADTPIDRYARVMILGSGLSMVDAWLSLAGHDHLGPILVVSRNGLFPQRHAPVTPLDFDITDIPLGTSAARFSRWLRGRVAETLEAGGDWRAVIDGLRPHNQTIWRNWSTRDRNRFLTHMRPFWNIHRHRLPPELHARLLHASRSGQITPIAGTFLGVEERGDTIVATIRRRGLEKPEEIEVARLYDCGGVTVNIEESSNPLINQLVRSGLARPDTLRIGLDITPEGALIGQNGSISKRVFALGPLTRSLFFEIESVPEIRNEAQRMARRLTAGAPAA